MRQDLNPNPSPCSSLVIFGHVKDKEEYFLQQGLARIVEMTEREGEKYNGNCFRKKRKSK